MRVLLATLALALSLSACARSADAPPTDSATVDPTAGDQELEGEALYPGEDGEVQATTIEDLRAESLAAIDKEACAAKNGEVRQEGLLGAWRCVVPFADAGKVCRDKADCEGKCLAPPESEAVTGDEAAGVCQANDSPFGCYAEIVEGKIAAALCVD